jgi:hypothetical protein
MGDQAELSVEQIGTKCCSMGPVALVRAWREIGC